MWSCFASPPTPDVTGHATALAARSSIVTQAYLHETIAPVVLGRRVSEREAIWHELWTIDRHLTFFPVYLPGPVDVALWDIAGPGGGVAAVSVHRRMPHEPADLRQQLVHAQDRAITSAEMQQLSASAASPPTRRIRRGRGGRISRFIARCAKPPARIMC